MEEAMAMEATTVRFAAEEREWIQSYADFCGKTFSDVVRESALERVEEAADLAAYQDALAEGDGTRIPFNEILVKYGMN
jgi:predicted DNA-binding protein